MELVRSLLIVAPEEVLSISGLLLLLVAAWGGDKAARTISILSVAALTVCAILVAPALCGGAMGPDVEAFARGIFHGAKMVEKNKRANHPLSMKRQDPAHTETAAQIAGSGFNFPRDLSVHAEFSFSGPHSPSNMAP